MAGMVKFEGQPPFILPEAKSAQAAVSEKSVAVTLYSQVEGQGPGLVSIAVQMPPDLRGPWRPIGRRALRWPILPPGM